MVRERCQFMLKPNIYKLRLSGLLLVFTRLWAVGESISAPFPSVFPRSANHRDPLYTWHSLHLLANWVSNIFMYPLTPKKFSDWQLVQSHRLLSVRVGTGFKNSMAALIYIPDEYRQWLKPHLQLPFTTESYDYSMFCKVGYNLDHLKNHKRLMKESCGSSSLFVSIAFKSILRETLGFLFVSLRNTERKNGINLWRINLNILMLPLLTSAFKCLSF